MGSKGASSGNLLLSLEVVEEDRALLALLTPVLDDNARAVDDLAGVALAVDLAETSPLAELLSVGDLDKRDLVLAAEGNNKLLVGLLLASLVEDTHVGLATVKGLGGLTETTGKTVVDQGDLEDTLEGVEDRHAASLLGVIGSDFDFFGGGDRGGGLFYIRHFDGYVLLCRVILEECLC